METYPIPKILQPQVQKTCGFTWGHCIAGDQHVCGLPEHHKMTSVNHGHNCKRAMQGME